MYDRNGLELTPQTNTMNSYKMTTIEVKKRKYGAYARAMETRNNEWTMYKIGYFNDPRDAAYIAQEFATHYDNAQIRQMVTDCTFDSIAQQFIANTEIPEWQYPAEGLLIEDILNDYEYKYNHVINARDALIEAIKVFGKKTPSLTHAKSYIDKVEELYMKGNSYREAARKVVEII